jgi:Sodium:sulfate symporter transmembrane region
LVATLGGEHAELLSEVELFRGLDRITLAKLAAHLEPLALTAGEILLRQGDRPDGLYLALEALPDGATSLLLVVIWVVGGVVPARTALSGFATATWILTVSVFAIAAAVATSGLLYRLALGAVARPWLPESGGDPGCVRAGARRGGAQRHRSDVTGRVGDSRAVGSVGPWVVAIVTLTASNTFFLPYQSTIYLALVNGTGSRLFSHAQARPVAIAFAALTLVGLLASVPIWRAMGLM